jgi:hypothetical protein
VAGLAGCKSLPYPDPLLEGDYGNQLARWTRTYVLYEGLETRGFCRVTYLADEFLDAQARKISEMRSESPEEAARTRERLHKDNATPSVFAIFYSPDKQANDWNEKNSVWRIALDLGLGQVQPEKMERFERPFNPEMRALYPYLDEYSVAYQIHFPAVAAQAPGGAAFTPLAALLLISGAPGRMEFRWDFQKLAQGK